MRIIQTGFLALSMLLGQATPALSQGIFQAVMRGDFDSTVALIEARPELIEATSWGDWTPLHRAAQFGHSRILEFLISRGADLESRTALGMTPLFVAVSQEQEEMVHLLLERGADLFAVRADGESMLHIAVAVGNRTMVDQLISAGLDVDHARRYGITPLHLAAAFGHHDVAETLIDHGARMDAADEFGRTAFDFAHAAGATGIPELLSAKGAMRESGLPGGLVGDYLGQTPPRGSPEPFAPGILFGTHRPHGGMTISPDGNEIYWVGALSFGLHQKLWRVVREGESWRFPEVAPFSHQGNFGFPRFSPDGETLFTNREVQAETPGAAPNYDIVYARRTETGWGDFINPGPPLNSQHYDSSPSVTDDGTVYFFCSGLEENLGSNDIYRSRFRDGRYEPPENLGGSINSASMEGTPFISPDESYLLFESFRPGGHGDFDIYISFRRDDGSWTPARNLGESINSARRDGSPFVSPDGRFLFFMSRRNGIGEFFWVDASIIDALRQESLGNV
jgi:Tol biopolymer transport system component